MRPHRAPNGRSTDGGDEIAVLLAIYQADRADNASTLSSAFALIGIGAAYVTGTVAFFGSIVHTLPAAVVACLPLPLWLMASYVTIMLASAIVRTRSIVTIEARLLRHVHIAPEYPIGSTAANMITDPRKSHWALGVVSVISQGGTLLLVAAYSLYVLVLDGRLAWWRVPPSAAYLALGVTLVLSWRASLVLSERVGVRSEGDDQPSGSARQVRTSDEPPRDSGLHPSQ